MAKGWALHNRAVGDSLKAIEFSLLRRMSLGHCGNKSLGQVFSALILSLSRKHHSSHLATVFPPFLVVFPRPRGFQAPGFSLHQ